MRNNKIRKTITILIPCYNEETTLPRLLLRLDKIKNKLNTIDLEYLFVNDGSKDKTLDIIKKYSKSKKYIAYIDLSRNFGKEAAMMAGIDNTNTDALIIVDADLQDPPELIPKMIKLWETGYDDIYARRKSRRGESILKKATSSLYYKILQKSTNIPIQKDTGDFRLLDKKCIDAIKKFRENNRNTKAIFSWIGYKKREILFDRDPRSAGKTKWSYVKLIDLAINGITSFTVAPLRIASILGLIISTFAFTYIVFIITKTLFLGVDTPGYASIMSVILLLGGVQLLSLGIIGEYIGKIFIETKKRPEYLINEIKNNNKK